MLLFSPLKIDAPITRDEALVVVALLALTLVVNAPLLRVALGPLERLAGQMDSVDLLHPGQRLPVHRDDEIGRVISTFNRMLDRLQDERQESARRILEAHESERADIARDLHDEVGQGLTTLLLQLDGLAERTPSQRAAIEEAKQSVRRALDEVRRLASRLRPEILEQLGLVSALTELTRTFSRASGIRVERRFATSLPALETAAELVVYRIVQESLTNIARHAQAARVTVSLERDLDGVVVRVVDDGSGLNGDPEEHGGLRGMRERALLVGGRLEVGQVSPSGVEVRLEVPIGAA